MAHKLCLVLFVYVAAAVPLQELKIELEEKWQESYSQSYLYSLALNPSYNYVQPPDKMPAVTYQSETATRIKFYFSLSTNMRLEMRLEEFEYDCANNFLLYFDAAQTQYQNSPCSAAAVGAGYKICGSDPINFVSSNNASYLHYCNSDTVNGVAVPPKILLGATSNPPYIPPTDRTTPAPTDQNQCGVPSVMTRYVTNGQNSRSNAKFSEDIIGGSETQPREYPWQVAFYNYNSFCGGSLLDKSHVLTAAHCIGNTDVNQMTVYLGAWNRSDFFEYDRIVCAVSKVVVHPGYSSSPTVNDLAMLTIDCGMEIIYNQAIRPVCLPTFDIAQQTGTPMIISGWGKTSGGDDGQTSQVLKAATTAIYDQQTCTNIWSPGVPQPGWLCAYSANAYNSACNGDSGGPIVGYDGSSFTLYGAVSFGSPGCPANRPSVFANTYYYLDWIKSQM